MSRILITGGAGYIGSHTTHYLLFKGVNPKDVFVFDNLVYGHQEFLPKGVNFIKGDLLNKEEVDDVFLNNSIDYVIHFAAYAYVGESMHVPGKYFENNILGGLNLLEAMLKGGCRKIIFSSTCATYGIPESNPIDECHVQKPINPYGESKLMFEKILEWYSLIYGVKSVRLRYFNACGAGFNIGELHIPETHLIPLILQAAKGERDSISVFGTDYDTKDGTCVRDYIHVLDLADAHYKAIDLLNDKSFETDYFNLGSGRGVSVKEVIGLVKEVVGMDFKVDYEKRRLGDPAVLVADPRKANIELDWRVGFDMKRIIVDAWNWEKNKEKII